MVSLKFGQMQNCQNRLEKRKFIFTYCKYEQQKVENQLIILVVKYLLTIFFNSPPLQFILQQNEIFNDETVEAIENCCQKKVFLQIKCTYIDCISDNSFKLACRGPSNLNFLGPARTAYRRPAELLALDLCKIKTRSHGTKIDKSCIFRMVCYDR